MNQPDVDWQREQDRLKKLIRLNNDVTLAQLKYVGGVDLSFPLNDSDHAVACVVVLEFPSLKVIHSLYKWVTLTLPYIPGYLAFREVGPLVELLNELKATEPDIYPQVILVDGNGILHPRQFGLASHLGVLSDTPCIGVAKNFLHIPEEGSAMEMVDVKARCKQALQKRGDTVDLIGASGIVYGVALRASDDAKNPVFVSQGHGVDLPTAVDIVLACSKFKNAEPIRQADGLSRKYIRDHNLSR
ncbi:hypothetical protein INT44_000628 [Umbelopsis vinacea]|uniref:Endonuclease V n=1 Tax=Umbelopsis vinacea TaxID=44442 RepID=A0A8H7Q8N4_9FUNG|nr:hypothetical protein INT44_000628 [Umbelopsis vinacea]